VEIEQVASIMAFTVARVARASSSVLYARISPMLAARIATASLTRGSGIAVNTAATRSASPVA